MELSPPGYGDNCNLNTALSNRFPQGINTSATVMEYGDVGGQYANVGFDVSNNFDLSTNHTFAIKIYAFRWPDRESEQSSLPQAAGWR
ncbi:MAG: hypothetical protein IPP25_09555 [Saprospiraceae bacterium]|nr:hypothetical protein [Candidatus Opimibacter skivensis]